MIFVIVLGALLLIGIAAVAIAWPLVQERSGMPEYAIGGEAAVVEDPLVELTARRDSVYQALRELRFDHQVGKVSEADYKVFDAQLKGQAVAVLKEIDGLKKAEADPELDAQIEAEIAALAFQRTGAEQCAGGGSWAGRAGQFLSEVWRQGKVRRSVLWHMRNSALS